MKPVLAGELKIGDKFFLDPSYEIEWTVIDTDPPQYIDSIRIKGVNITAPLRRYNLVYIQQ